jgi:hypothetical protein
MRFSIALALALGFLGLGFSFCFGFSLSGLLVRPRSLEIIPPTVYELVRARTAARSQARSTARREMFH